jgi:hypothetical protein
MSDRAEADQEMSVRRVRWPLVDIKIQILFFSSCRTERSLQASGDLAGSNSAATVNWEMQEILSLNFSFFGLILGHSSDRTL